MLNRRLLLPVSVLLLIVPLGFLGCTKKEPDNSATNGGLPLANPREDGALDSGFPGKSPADKGLPTVGSDDPYVPHVYTLARCTKSIFQESDNSSALEAVSEDLMDLDFPEGPHRQLLADYRNLLLKTLLADTEVDGLVEERVEILTRFAGVLVPFSINGIKCVEDGQIELAEFVTGAHLLNVLYVNVQVHGEASDDSKILDMPRYADFAVLVYLGDHVWDDGEMAVIMQSAMLGKLDMLAVEGDSALKAGNLVTLTQFLAVSKQGWSDAGKATLAAVLAAIAEQWEIDASVYRENGYADTARTTQAINELNVLLHDYDNSQ